MAKNDPPQDTGRPGRGRRWLLYISLAFNLLIVGVVVGAVATGGGRDGPGVRAVIDSPIPLLRALDQDAREQMRAALRDSRAARSDAPFAAVRTTRDILGALRADPFDAAEFEALVTQQSERFAARNAAGRAALFEVVSDMGPEARRAYADRIEDALRARRDRGPRPPRQGSGG